MSHIATARGSIRSQANRRAEVLSEAEVEARAASLAAVLAAQPSAPEGDVARAMSLATARGSVRSQAARAGETLSDAEIERRAVAQAATYA